MVNDRYLQEIEYDLKMRMKAAKRKPVNNAKTQVRSFNTSTRPERILDHNDPYKVEWTDPAVEGEYIIGQKVQFRIGCIKFGLNDGIIYDRYGC